VRGIYIEVLLLSIIVKRDQLIDSARDVLAKTGFFLSEPHGERGLCFDFVARRDNLLLIVKVLQNVDALNKGTAEELKNISRSLRGSPVVLGDRTGTGALEDGVIYSRFGVPILSRKTFLDFFEEGVPPFIYSAPGGLYVRLDMNSLRRFREQGQLSLGTLADIAGVSRRTIQMYLEGMSASIDVAARLEEFLHEPLVLPMDPFAFLSPDEAAAPVAARLEAFERELFQRLERLGYSVLPTVRSPFDGLARHDERTYLAGVESADTKLEKKAAIVSNIGRVVEKDAVMFVERRTVRLSIQGLPVIAREELRKVKDRDAVEDLIAERKG
jgi:putative transcriptional regulator